MDFKTMICDELRDTQRLGIERLIEHMEQIGFFEAPCSTQYHLANQGGLAEHSYNVLICARKMAHVLPGANEPDDSITIICLLHDLGKCGQFNKQFYQKAPLLKSGKEPAKPYITNSDLLPTDHEVRSVAIAGQFIELTEEEQYAILMHNGLYGVFRNVVSKHETPLYLLVHSADMWASRIVEEGEVSE